MPARTKCILETILFIYNLIVKSLISLYIYAS